MKTVKEIVEDSVAQSLDLVPSKSYSFSQVNTDGKEIKHKIEPSEFKRSLENKFNEFDSFSKIFINHIKGHKNMVAAFASSPTAFANAWNMKAEELIAEDVLSLSKDGGHFQFE